MTKRGLREPQEPDPGFDPALDLRATFATVHWRNDECPPSPYGSSTCWCRKPADPKMRAPVRWAEQITQEIFRTTVRLHLLLAEAYEGKAHFLLGYERWEDYAREEFKMSRQRTYQLLHQAAVEKAFSEAAGFHVAVIERDARKLHKEVIAAAAAHLKWRINRGDDALQALHDIITYYGGRASQRDLIELAKVPGAAEVVQPFLDCPKVLCSQEAAMAALVTLAGAARIDDAWMRTLSYRQRQILHRVIVGAQSALAEVLARFAQLPPPVPPIPPAPPVRATGPTTATRPTAPPPIRRRRAA